MIVLDTNVVSEIMRPRPAAAVLAWLDAQAATELWLTSTVAAELMYGVARLPDGARKQQFARSVSGMLERDFSGRVLPFDLAAASLLAELLARRERAGQALALADAQIASVCLVHGATLATRNQQHFEGIGLAIVNPSAAAAPTGA